MQAGMMTTMERMRWATYGLLPDLFVGLFLGWMFHGFVGMIVRLVIIAIILAPFVVALIFWLKVSNKNRMDRADSGIQEAEWHDLNTRARTGDAVQIRPLGPENALNSIGPRPPTRVPESPRIGVLHLCPLIFLAKTFARG